MNRVRHPWTRLIVSILVAASVAVGVGAGVAGAEKVKVANGQRVEFRKKDYRSHAGKVVAYDDWGFDLKPSYGGVERIGWHELDVKTQYVVWRNAIGRKDGPAHVELGRRMLGIDGGEEWAEKAFALAVKLDPKLKEKVAEARESPLPAPPGGPDPAASEGDEEGDGAGAGDDELPEEAQRLFGGMLARERREGSRAKNVEKLKAFADETQERMGKPLKLHETLYFLFYSDLPDEEARRWAGLLDRMHARLCELFGLPEFFPIWRGAALVFVFQGQADYVRFQREMHETDAAGTAGMCHKYPDGFVHIAFYRQPEELEFAHVLVHESVHGFVHRYKTQEDVPSWAEEGLAEWIAGELVPRPGRARAVLDHAKAKLREQKGVGTLFDAEHIEGWQYPVAEMLTTFMIERNKGRYVGFIEGIKAGTPWEESLRTNFGMDRTKLLKEFGRSAGI